jgi:hypothetical protein
MRIRLGAICGSILCFRVNSMKDLCMLKQSINRTITDNGDGSADNGGGLQKRSTSGFCHELCPLC